MENGKASRRLRLEITWATIFKLLLGVLIAYLAIKLWPVAELIAVSILVAVVLYRIVAWISSKGWPRWLGVLLATLALLLVIGGLFGLIIPMATSEIRKLASSLPKLQERVLANLPNGRVHDMVQGLFKFGSGADSQQMLSKGFTVVKSTLGGLIDGVVVFALVIYLLIDGPRTLEWWVAFFPRQKRPRIAQGLEEIGSRIVAYVTGQFIVSVLFATYTAILLSVLRVPMALLLGVLAGMVDILPFIGILIALVPAGLMALTVSPTTALLVLVGYLCYHGIEDYFIVPKVYGNKLKISTLAVLVAMLVGAVLAGVIGAITALPLVAAYPCLERLWFARQVEPEVLEDHAKLRAA